MFNIEATLGDAGVITALIIIGGLIFAECAFLIGLVVPGGDLLLLASGVFAAQGNLPLAGVIAVVFIAAMAGYEVGYYIGAKTGAQVFKQKTGGFFKKEYADRTAHFYAAHGGKTVLIARYIAYVRTVAPILAGIAKMPRRKFVIYNVSGALLWSVSLIMLGYWFGSAFTDVIKRYEMLITVVSLLILGSGLAVYFFNRKKESK